MTLVHFIQTIGYPLLVTGLGWMLTQMLKNFAVMQKKVAESITREDAEKMIRNEVADKLESFEERFTAKFDAKVDKLDGKLTNLADMFSKVTEVKIRPEAS